MTYIKKNINGTTETKPLAAVKPPYRNLITEIINRATLKGLHATIEYAYDKPIERYHSSMGSYFGIYLYDDMEVHRGSVFLPMQGKVVKQGKWSGKPIQINTNWQAPATYI